MNHPLHSTQCTVRLFISLMFISALSCMTTSVGIIATAYGFNRDGVEVNIIDAGHARLPAYHHRGELYVLGRHHQRYVIQITNHSGERIEAVVTVDGRDVINGQPGAYRHRGYVIDPHDSIEIEGFRRSTSEVATFRFTTPGDSYASRMGDGRNIGVIGVATFAERGRRHVHTHPHRRAQRHHEHHEAHRGAHEDMRSSDEALSARGPSGLTGGSHSRRRIAPRPSAPQSEIGTQYGENRHSSSVETTFHRASQRPFTLFTITYDSERGLRRRGVISSYTPRPGRPNPFPQQYAPSPY